MLSRERTPSLSPEPTLPYLSRTGSTYSQASTLVLPGRLSPQASLSSQESCCSSFLDNGSDQASISGQGSSSLSLNNLDVVTSDGSDEHESGNANVQPPCKSNLHYCSLNAICYTHTLGTASIITKLNVII